MNCPEMIPGRVTLDARLWAEQQWPETLCIRARLGAGDSDCCLSPCLCGSAPGGTGAPGEVILDDYPSAIEQAEAAAAEFGRPSARREPF